MVFLEVVRSKGGLRPSRGASAAARFVEGIRAGEFYIVTHPHAVGFAQERWAELEQAFAAQAPRREGDERYNLEPIMRQLMAQQAQQGGES